MGALAGAALPQAGLLIIGFALMRDGGAGWSMVFVLAPILVALATTAIAMLVFGLPVTLFLKRKRRETRDAYMAAGLFGGLVCGILVWIVWDVMSGLVLGAFAMISGLVTANTWWVHGRKREVEQGEEQLRNVFS